MVWARDDAYIGLGNIPACGVIELSSIIPCVHMLPDFEVLRAAQREGIRELPHVFYINDLVE